MNAPFLPVLTRSPLRLPFLTVVVMARLISAVYGFMFVFGSLFFGAFDFLAGAGICALAVAFIPATSRGTVNARSEYLLVVSMLGACFQLVDMAIYYFSSHAPGNYYPLPETVGGFFCMGVIALHGASSLPWDAKNVA